MKLITPTAFHKTMAYFFIFLIMFYFTSCNYFLADKVGAENLPTLLEIGKVQKYFVLYQGDEVYHLDSPSLKENVLMGMLVEPGVNNDTISIYYNETRKSTVRDHEKSIYQEVHLYTHDDSDALSLGDFEMPIEQIREIRVIKPDTGKTIMAVLGSAAGIFAIVVIIVALTKSSCPYLYVYDGEDFLFEGEMYGGAILQNMERNDYMPLPDLRPVNSTFKLRIANELKEEQFTNLARLVLVDHPGNTQVLLDQKGQPHLLRDPQLPRQALSANGKDIGAQLSNIERDVYLFDEIEADQNRVEMHFDKPEGASLGKLVLNAKNTLWFDWLFGEFTKKFGGHYDQWIENQAAVSSEERWQMAVDRGFPLTVSIKMADGWRVLEQLPTVGPMAARDLVIPVDLSQHPGQDIVIRLQCGFLFWELDYAAMDFSPNEDIKMREVVPMLAVGSDGQDHIAALSSDDDQYLRQLNTGDITELHFRAVTPAKGRAQSTFLHSKGYYKHIRDYSGLPQVMELKKFRDPAYFNEFSKQVYLRIVSPDEELVAGSF